MRFTGLRIRNFKSIRDMRIGGIENALILVGKNNTGKTSILDAVRAVTGNYRVGEADFDEARQNIEIEVELEISEEDRRMMHLAGVVSRYKRYEIWERDFRRKLPSFDGEHLTFSFVANWEGKVRYADGYRKDNPYIREVMPKIYHIDAGRDLDVLQNDLLLYQDNRLMNQMRAGSCLFDASKGCRHCFQCIGLINQKSPLELDAAETKKLLEYKLYQLNMGGLAERINENFHKNGGYDDILLELRSDVDRMYQVQVETFNSVNGQTKPVERMSKGMRSIYMLSLLETYVEGENKIPSIIVVEYPELFLHPQLQKTSSEILYRLSKKNQVIFATHSPQLLLNFTSGQIRQVVLGDSYLPRIREHADIGGILDDLGYGAGDVMNVDFVFIVEGKQDKSRLPLLLERYYAEVHDGEGRLSRIAIITTNSCTNIKTYANLKYMNQVYLREQFLMIRDGDGKDAMELRRQLCRYYEEQNARDVDRLPRVRPEHVLILKYYSFENYFLNPAVMAKLQIVESEEQFYETLWKKWNEYLYRLKSGRQFVKALGRAPESADDLREHMELFKIHMRGHNLYDIFYGRYKKQEREILKQYIELAPREDFADILDSIDHFMYFDSRKKMPG